ncbi:MAG TPA: VOC family protein [Actinophytocola sp.]|uniref:VOC family protein n=1 Tax=Actinophytocola sp. TaxID=1872138 RepID=UPI002DBD7CC1|nr:VOC family protein [Actinophytocola sp.]HEU5471867.1 VOC family protein [Actinophytocola sp.]
MLAAAELTAFVPTTDLERARAFYGGTLGLELESVNEFACVFRSAGTMLRVTKVSGFDPQRFTVLGWAVPDIYATARELTDAGIPAVRYEGVEQDDDGVWANPDGVRVLWFKDPDGNTLSIAQYG